MCSRRVKYGDGYGYLGIRVKETIIRLWEGRDLKSWKRFVV